MGAKGGRVFQEQLQRSHGQNKKKRERTQVNKIRIERGELTTDTNKIQRIVRIYYEQLYANKLDNLDKMVKFLETYSLPNQNQEESENLSRQITPSEIGAVIKKRRKNLPTYKSPGQMASQVNFTKHSRKNQHLSFSNYFKNFKRRESSQAHFTRTALC